MLRMAVAYIKCIVYLIITFIIILTIDYKHLKTRKCILFWFSNSTNSEYTHGSLKYLLDDLI